MAEIIDSNVESLPVNRPSSVWKIALIGLTLGILYWCLTALIMNFIKSIDIAGNIVTILVGLIGIVVMLKMFIARPLLVALASAVALWGLASMTDGLVWYEIIAWSALLYGLSYTVFSWIASYKKTVPAVVAVIVVVAIIRLVIIL
jgi:hypothetical protein